MNKGPRKKSLRALPSRMLPERQGSLISSTVRSPVQTAPRAFRILTANMRSKRTFKRPACPAPSSLQSSSWRICCSRGCSRVCVRGSSPWQCLPAARCNKSPWPTSGRSLQLVIERNDTVFGRRFEIAGDELTGQEAAAILSKVMGREVRYEGFPPDVLRAQNEDLARMFEWFDHTGYAANMKSLRRDFPEVTWHTFEEWARKQDWSVEALGA